MSLHHTFVNPLFYNLSDHTLESGTLSMSDSAKNFWESGKDASIYYEEFFDFKINEINNDENTFNLESKNPKLIITVIPGVHHLFNERFAIALEWFKRHEDGNVLFFYDEGQWFDKNLDLDLFYFFNLFNDYIKQKSAGKQKCFLIKMSKDTKFIVNNFWFFKDYINIRGKYHLSKNLKEIRDFYKTKKEPFRKVYISRQKTIQKSVHFTTGTKVKDFIKLNRFDDERVYNEEILQDYLISEGFEIIYPEDFKNMEEQIKFLSETKIMICSTHSGISNMVWLPDNATVIEISVPVVVGKTELLETSWFHLSVSSQILYISIPSFSGEANDIIKKIKLIFKNIQDINFTNDHS
jgi:hypothetical protein